jgi:hypothetical protein
MKPICAGLNIKGKGRGSDIGVQVWNDIVTSDAGLGRFLGTMGSSNFEYKKRGSMGTKTSVWFDWVVTTESKELLPRLLSKAGWRQSGKKWEFAGCPFELTVDDKYALGSMVFSLSDKYSYVYDTLGKTWKVFQGSNVVYAGMEKKSWERWDEASVLDMIKTQPRRIEYYDEFLSNGDPVPEDDGLLESLESLLKKRQIKIQGHKVLIASTGEEKMDMKKIAGELVVIAKGLVAGGVPNTAPITKKMDAILKKFKSDFFEIEYVIQPYPTNPPKDNSMKNAVVAGQIHLKEDKGEFAVICVRKSFLQKFESDIRSSFRNEWKGNESFGANSFQFDVMIEG